MDDPSIAEVSELWGEVSMALVGIGAIEPSPLLERSGNGIREDDQALLRGAGSVGDVVLRFFDADGELIRSALDERVVGISPEAFREIPRRVGVAGGSRKVAAIRGAIVGGWVNVLVTDVAAARALLAAQPASESPRG